MEHDFELLRQFVENGDTEAFTAIVHRHSAMVRGVALRRTGNSALAEEVAQTVFAVLARKAAALSHGNLAGWLHHAACLESRATARKAARYRAILHQYGHQMNSPHGHENGSWEEVRLHLDEALARLRADERNVVVLHYLEKHSVRDIASATGRTEQACRKKLQRAIICLRRLLAKRGVGIGPAALATMLTGQSLCSPSASAALLAASALKVAPTIKTQVLISQSLNLMNATTTAKAAAVLVIAAIPITMLWRKNADLQQRVHRLSSQVASEPPPQTIPAPPRVVATTSEEPPPETAANPDTPGEAKSLAALAQQFFSGEGLAKRASEEARKHAEQDFKRISLNISNLTDEQKARIKETFERRNTAAAERIIKVLQGGGLAKIISDPGSLTDEEKEVLAMMDSRKHAIVREDDPLRSILTEEQFSQYAKAQETKRIGDAENAASDSLKSVSRILDLGAEQKDAIFQDLAQSELSPEDATTLPGFPGFPGMDPRESARDEIIRQHLTPEQLQVFDESREEAKKGRMQMLQIILPAMTGEGTP